MSEEMIVEFCSPTLAGIKTGNLFSCDYKNYKGIVKDLRRINAILVKKGIKAIPIRCLNHRVLIYIFRESFLEKDLCDRDTAKLLIRLGYNVENTDECICMLSRKINSIKSSDEFPHEIGLFLGYPYEDVKGFIEHKGQYSKSIGYWKVYGDVNAAKNTFDRYKKCTSDYVTRFKDGMTLDQLTVCA